MLTRSSGLRYGDEALTAASYFLRKRSRESTFSLPMPEIPWAPNDFVPPIHGAMALVRVLAQLPRIDVRLSDSPPGREIDKYLSIRVHGVCTHRLAQGVLHIPGRPGEYLRGRSRQAVRTNLHRAEAANIECRFPPNLQSGAGTVELIAFDGRGENVGHLSATVDSEWAMLRDLVGTQSEARYALHTALVTFLCSRGVRFLFVQGPGALVLPPGLQYFQHLLGYRVAHLRVRYSGQRRRRGASPAETSMSEAPGRSQRTPRVRAWFRSGHPGGVSTGIASETPPTGMSTSASIDD